MLTQRRLKRVNNSHSMILGLIQSSSRRRRRTEEATNILVERRVQGINKFKELKEGRVPRESVGQ